MERLPQRMLRRSLPRQWTLLQIQLVIAGGGLVLATGVFVVLGLAIGWEATIRIYTFRWLVGR